MSSLNWKKLKSLEEVKALFRHDEREKREDTEFHRNFHIDKSKTYRNYSLIGRDYRQRCDMCDETINEALSVMANNVETYTPKKGKNAGKTMQRKKSKLRKDATIALNLCVTVPKNLPLPEYYRWFKAVHDILVDFFGEENVIDSDVHLDEVHEYFDTFLKEWVWSREHMHTTVMARTKDGRLCCNEIFTRENCKKLNDLVEEMTQREFGIAFNTGETPRKETVEDLKAKSIRKEKEMRDELEAEIAKLEAKKTELEEHNAKLDSEISGKEKRLEDLNTEISEREERKNKVNAEISDKAEYLDALKTKESSELKRFGELDAEIFVKESFLESLNTELLISEQYSNELKAEISEREKRKATLEAKAAELAQVTAQVEDKRAEYDALTVEMNARKSDIEKREKANDDCKKSLDERKKGLDDREIALDVKAAKIKEAEEEVERIKAETKKEAEEEADRIKAEAKKETEKEAERIIAEAEEKAKGIIANAIQKKKEAEAIKKRLEARETANNRADKAETALNAPSAPNARHTRFDRAAAGDFSR